MHRAWVYKLKARYEAEGETALEPRSRRPKTIPDQTPEATVELVLRLRKQLTDAGLDAGADTIAWHLSPSPQLGPLPRHDQPDPGQCRHRDPRPVQASEVLLHPVRGRPAHQTWQSDFTHYRLAHPTAVHEIVGVVTLRYDSQLRHIGLGRVHARKRVLLLVADRYARVVDAETGETLRELTIDPTKDYQPLGRPPGPPKADPSRSPEMQRCPATPVNGVAGHHNGRADRI